MHLEPDSFDSFANLIFLVLLTYLSLLAVAFLMLILPQFQRALGTLLPSSSFHKATMAGVGWSVIMLGGYNQQHHNGVPSRVGYQKTKPNCFLSLLHGRHQITFPASKFGVLLATWFGSLITETQYFLEGTPGVFSLHNN